MKINDFEKIDSSSACTNLQKASSRGRKDSITTTGELS